MDVLLAEGLRLKSLNTADLRRVDIDCIGIYDDHFRELPLSLAKMRQFQSAADNAVNTVNTIDLELQQLNGEQSRTLQQLQTLWTQFRARNMFGTVLADNQNQEVRTDVNVMENQIRTLRAIDLDIVWAQARRTRSLHIFYESVTQYNRECYASFVSYDILLDIYKMRIGQ